MSATPELLALAEQAPLTESSKIRTQHLAVMTPTSLPKKPNVGPAQPMRIKILQASLFPSIYSK